MQAVGIHENCAFQHSMNPPALLAPFAMMDRKILKRCHSHWSGDRPASSSSDVSDQHRRHAQRPSFDPCIEGHTDTSACAEAHMDVKPYGEGIGLVEGTLGRASCVCSTGVPPCRMDRTHRAPVAAHVRPLGMPDHAPILRAADADQMIVAESHADRLPPLSGADFAVSVCLVPNRCYRNRFQMRRPHPDSVDVDVC